ncbi:MAG: two-component system sensor histidine kinase RppB [Cyanobacteria bacterium J06627_28]
MRTNRLSPLITSPSTSGSQLFEQSRLRLARWYAGAMGGILALLGVGVYYAIAHAHSVTADRELQSVSDTVRDAILDEVIRPEDLARLPPSLLPDLCVGSASCLVPVNGPSQQPLGTYPSGYYIRIVAPDDQLLATAGDRPTGLPITAPMTEPMTEWQSIKDAQGRVYHQRSQPLSAPSPNSQNIDRQTVDNPDQVWAYLIVGSAFREFHTYLAAVRWSLLVGFVLAVALIAVASWWLAELAMRPIYQSYQQIQQFTADAAHELRTPLAATQATVESVLRLPHLSEQEAQETLRVVSRQNKRLTALVSNLLLLSRFDSGRFDSTQQHNRQQLCCLPDVLNDITEEMAAIALAKKIALSVDIQTPPNLSVLGNEEQLYRLLLNLVNNALTYTPEGGCVTLTLKQQQKEALITVSDTGIGIASEHQEKIFDRFYRVDGSRAGQAGNAGLGLAIASAIAKAHGGNLTVISQLDKGSTFTISLPKDAMHFGSPSLPRCL